MSLRTPRSNALFLDWLHSGVSTNVISLKQAFDLYKIKTNISFSKFGSILYDK